MTALLSRLVTMSDDDDQPPLITTSEVQGQLDGLLKGMKKMGASITTPVKAITLKDNAATQSGSDGVMDPQTVPENATDPRRAQDTESVKEGDGHVDHEADDSSTYPIQESTSAFLKLAFRLKKPIDNKTHKTWQAKFRIPECDVTRYPKLDTIIKEVIKKYAIDEDQELSRL